MPSLVFPNPAVVVPAAFVPMKLPWMVLLLLVFTAMPRPLKRLMTRLRIVLPLPSRKRPFALTLLPLSSTRVAPPGPLLPSIVTARVDKKTIVSRNDWMNLRTEFREPLSDMARSATVRTAPGIDGARVVRFVDSYFSGTHDDHLAMWRLYTGWRWLELFQPGG